MRSVATISLAHNYIRVFDFYDNFEMNVLRKFCKAELTKYGQEPIPNSRKKRWVPTHVFARTNNDRTEYRLPRSVLEPLLKLAVAMGYNKARIKLEEEPELEGVDVEFTIKEKYSTPREEQKDWINYKLNAGPLKVNEASTGLGKGQRLSSKIKTPTGWTTMGELKVGDSVIAWDGSVTKVTGVSPQGSRKLFRVVFEDYRYTDVDLSHMWEVFDYNGPKSPGDDSGTCIKVLDTEMLLECKKDERRWEGLHIPLLKPNLPTKEKDLSRLKELLGKKPTFINGGYLAFATYSYHDAEEVTDLVRSLGGKARKGDSGPIFNRYVIHIELPDPKEVIDNPKFAHWVSLVKPLAKPELKILDIVDLGIEEETQCISIEHPSRLYVTDDYIVTHNTYMSLYCMAEMGKRTLITIQPRYIPIWQKDLADMFDIAAKDILVWEYSDLPRLGELCKGGDINPKIIILPTTRISTYMRARRKDGNLPCLDEIIANINPGLRIIDESHESFHEVCLSMLYGNVKKTFMLSATLKGDDPFLNKMYATVAPINIRLKEPEPENYIDIIAYLYQVDIRKYKVQTQQFGSYNDIALEKSILKSKELTDFYFELADDMYKRFYLDAKEEGTKCIFFFTLVEMCLLMKEKFRLKYPGEDFDTFLGTLDKKTPKKYLEHENLITTPGSCGTGKDIPGAITCISFHTVSSIQRNKQMIGRLRNLRGKFGGRITPRFVFPVCVDIAKHGDYFHKRKLAFSAKQKSWKTLNSGLALQ